MRRGAVESVRPRNARGSCEGRRCSGRRLGDRVEWRGCTVGLDEVVSEEDGEGRGH